jgi:glycopeptide antibiotics resistance protein
MRGDNMEKIISRGLLAFYLVILTWLVLFKLQYNILSVFHYQYTSFNLIPFAASGSIREMIDNILIFIPLGLLLEVNFKKGGFSPKLFLVLALSITFEFIQLIFAIGATDITDVITNTVGGLLGLKLYGVCNRLISSKKLDWVILLVGIFLLVLLVYYRTHLVIRYS